MLQSQATPFGVHLHIRYKLHGCNRTIICSMQHIYDWICNNPRTILHSFNSELVLWYSMCLKHSSLAVSSLYYKQVSVTRLAMWLEKKHNNLCVFLWLLDIHTSISLYDHNLQNLQFTELEQRPPCSD